MDPSHDDDAVWRALAHPTRRHVLDLLAESALTTGELVAALGADRHVVMGHLTVLREADLVLTERRGRYRVNHLNPVPIQRIHQRWVTPTAGPWAAALIAVRDEAERASRSSRAVEDTIENRTTSG